MSVRFFKWSKGILGILRFFGGAEEMLGGVGRKTLLINKQKAHIIQQRPTTIIGPDDPEALQCSPSKAQQAFYSCTP